MGEGDIGLRERKKQRTREQIVEQAMALFDEHGFEHVTIADIAGAADIAPRTFFSYFPSKEDVVFHDFEAIFTSLHDRLAGRPASESAIDTMRDWVAEILDGMDPTDPNEQCRHRVIHASPALQERDRALVGRFERELAEAIASDLDAESGSLRPRMVAAAAAAALTELEHFFDKDHMPENPMAIVDEVFVFVRGGIAALQRHPAKR